MPRFFVGVSGFSYPGWKGTFYTPETKSEEFLGFYSKRLRSVEVNSSFYAEPGAATVKSWAAKTPESFRFSFKVPKAITHIMKMGDGASEAAGRFSNKVELLGPRLGPILFQLPPYLGLNEGLLSEFLSETDGVGRRVFEFRQESWFNPATFKLLEGHGVGFCVEESEEIKPRLLVTGETAYFRLRNESYDEKSVDSWAKKVRETVGGAKECYVYLRHDDSGRNAVLAERLAARLD